MAWDTGLQTPEQIERQRKMADLLRAEGMRQREPLIVRGNVMRQNVGGDILSGFFGNAMAQEADKNEAAYNTASDNALANALRKVPSTTEQQDKLNGPWAPTAEGTVPGMTSQTVARDPGVVRNETNQWLAENADIPGIKGKVLERSLGNIIDTPDKMVEAQQKLEAAKQTAEYNALLRKSLAGEKIASQEKIAGNTDVTNQARNKANFMSNRVKEIIGTVDTTGHSPAELSQLQNAAVARAESEWNNSQGQAPSPQIVNSNVSMQMDATDPNFVRDAQAMVASGDPEKMAVGKAMLAQSIPPSFKGRMQGAPVIVAGPNGAPTYAPPQAAVGQTAAPKPTAASAPLTPAEQDAADLVADRYIAGDSSALIGLGRNQKLMTAVLTSIAAKAKAKGIDANELVQRGMENVAEKRAQQIVGAQKGKIGMAAAEAYTMTDIVREYSDKIDHTEYPTINAIQNAIARGTGDTNIVQLNAALNGLINTYARAINPNGQPTVADKTHAREVIDAAYSNGQIDAALDVMAKEMEAAKASGSSFQKTLRGERQKQYGTNPPAAAPAAPATPPAAPAAAIQYLKAHPESREAFKAKYGYVP